MLSSWQENFQNQNLTGLYNHQVICQPEKNHKDSLKQVYALKCEYKKTNFKFNGWTMFFPFERQCYEQEADGYWRFQKSKVTEDAFEEFKVDSMPDSYIEAASKAFYSDKNEICVAQKGQYFAVKEHIGWANRQTSMNQLARFETSQKLGQVLEKLPIVNMHLNSNQMKILNSPGDLFILGRSGTGKTTSTILRFFCQEAMFTTIHKQERLLNSYAKSGYDDLYKKTRKKLPQLTAADLDEDTKLKMVFVTASPVLTNEVKQYYSSLKSQLKAHLTIVEKAQEAKKSDDQSDNPDSDLIIKTEEQKEVVENEREKMIKFLEMREQEIIQAEQVEQQLAIPNNVRQLCPKHFPLFLTVQRLVYMLDATCSTSFFSRRNDG